MKGNAVEIILGAVVLMVATLFLGFSYSRANIRTESGNEFVALFSNINGIKPGSEVRISGVKIGGVTEILFDIETYQARVLMMLQDNIELTLDTTAAVRSEGLLGDKFVALEIGGDEELIQPCNLHPEDEYCGLIENTQPSVSLEQILGQVVFGLTKPNQDAP